MHRSRRGQVTASLWAALTLVVLVAYVASAATQHAGSWMFFAYDDRVLNSANGKHIDISGSGNTLHGDIKSNGDFDAGGSNNTFNGIVRYYDGDGDPKLADNDYNDGNPSQE